MTDYKNMNVYAVIRGGTKGSGRRSHDQQYDGHSSSSRYAYDIVPAVKRRKVINLQI